MLNFLGLLAPIFFVVVLLEWYLGRRKGKEVFQFSDAIANMCAGMAERMFDFFWAIIMLFAFKWIYDNFAVFEIPRTVWTWILCLLAYDFLYYWYHRLGHESNFLWAIHIVHHQSEEYNYTVASRQSGFQAIAKTFFIAPLPLIGFAPEFAWTVFIAAGVHQFFLHTRLIGRLGFLEYIFVTPSLHRVHHGRNEEYLDKNYGGVFIFWDMLYGTYEKEEAEVRFGITSGFNSRNVYWSYFHYWVDLFKQAREIPKWKDKIALFLQRPGWLPEEVKPKEAPKPKPLDRPKYAPKAPTQLTIYILLQVFICLVLLAGMMIQKGDVKNGYASLEAFYTEYMTPWEVAAYAALITMATLTIPVLVEKRKWVYYAEQLRLVMMAIGVPFILLEISVGNPWGSLIAGSFFACSAWLFRMRRFFSNDLSELNKPDNDNKDGNGVQQLALS